MAQQIQAFSITAPGFFGLNTQDSSLDLDKGWALVANNCVIDQYGRIGARKGYTKQHSTLAALGTADVKVITELIDAAGNSYTLCAGNNKIFKLVGTTLSEVTFNGVGTAPTITDSNWSTAYLDGDLYFFQRGHVPIGFDPGTSTTTYYRVDQESGYNGTVQLANIIISAYGRMWNADTSTDKVTVQWSDTKNPHKWGSGTAGTLDTTTVWPKGGDTIVALAAHNNFLYIFGKRNILIYQGANTPATMTLYDVVTGIGCIARDSVANTGTDVIFLSETGLRSISRTIQEKSAPLNDLSKNVRNDLITAVSGEDPATIKSVYSPLEGFYLLSLPLTKQVYCFDAKAALPDGSLRVTTWDTIEPKSFCQRSDGSLLLGRPGYVCKYTGYFDNDDVTYRMQYYTQHTDLGTPNVTSILKKLKVVVIGGTDQVVTVKWAYDFTGAFQSQNVTITDQAVSYYGVGEYGIAYYTDGIALQTITVYPTGSGKVVQTGYETEVKGYLLSIQKLEIHAKNGKIA
jgi:hypothetical protein